MKPSVLLTASLLFLAACPKKGPESTVGTDSTQGPTDSGTTASTGTKPTTPTPAASAKEEEVSASAPEFEQVNAALHMLGDDATRAKGVMQLQALKAKYPKNAYIVFNLAVASYLNNDIATAQRGFEQTVELDPSIGQAWVYLGALDERAGRLDAAVARYRGGLAKDPENQDLWGALVGVLRKMGRSDDAINEGKKALKINANNLSVYNNLGLIYLDRGELDLAKFVYNKALVGIPGAEENAYIHANLGRVLFEDKNYPGAQAHLEKAVELDPNFVPALIYLSHLHLDNRNFKAMVPLLENARKFDPDNHSVLVNLGIAYRGLGRLDDAIAVYQRALELKPNNPDPWFNLGIIYGDYKKDYAQAITSFQTYIDKGGKEKATALLYIEEVKKEKEKAEAKAAREAKRKQREQERVEREKLLKEQKAAEEAGSATPSTPTEAPAAPTEAPAAPTEEPAAPTEAPAEPTPTEGGGE